MPTLDLLLSRLAETGRTTHDFFAGLSAADLARPIYPDPVWTARDILAHLITTERGVRPLILGVTRGEPGAPEGFDIDAANARLLETMRGLSVPELLTTWTAERAATVAAYADLDEAALARRGRHPFLGETDVVDMIQLMYRHEMLHVRDVRRGA
jgi:hypothetical protein